MYFPLNDARGQRAFDLAGRKLDGVLGQSESAEPDDPAWTPAGVLGGALSFDGVDDCVLVPDSPELGFGGGLTIMTWIKRTGPVTVDGGIFVSKAYTLQKRAWSVGFYFDTNRFAAYLFDSDDALHDLLSPMDLTADLDTWYHVATTYDPATGKQSLYINGTDVASKDAEPFEIESTTVPVRVGCYNNSDDGSISRGFLPGLIDEVMIFNRALEASAIAAYYNGIQ